MSITPLLHTCPQLAYLTIPYSQLDGGGGNVDGASWGQLYRHYRKFVCHMDSYVANVEIGYLATAPCQLHTARRAVARL